MPGSAPVLTLSATLHWLTPEWLTGLRYRHWEVTFNTPTSDADRARAWLTDERCE